MILDGCPSHTMALHRLGDLPPKSQTNLPHHTSHLTATHVFGQLNSGCINIINHGPLATTYIKYMLCFSWFYPTLCVCSLVLMSEWFHLSKSDPLGDSWRIVPPLRGWIPSGKLAACDWKWPISWLIMVDLPIKVVMFHSCVSSPKETRWRLLGSSRDFPAGHVWWPEG